MSTGQSSLMVATEGRTVCVKINGRANVTISQDFKALVDKVTEGGSRRVLLDLTECVTMDSTFLGVLSGAALKCSKPETGSGPITLYNPAARICETIDNLGVSYLFEVATDEELRPNAYEAVTQSGEAPTLKDRTRTALEAHRLLMSLNPANVAKFKDVVHFLLEDLKKQELPPPPKPS